MPKPAVFSFLTLSLGPLARGADALAATDPALEQSFRSTVNTLVETFCVSCHGREKPEAELELSPSTTTSAVVSGFST